MVRVDNTSTEFQRVSLDMFHRSYGEYELMAAFRIKHPEHITMYTELHNSDTVAGVLNEAPMLYHHTLCSIGSTVIHGLGQPDAYQPTRFGQGLYFSDDPRTIAGLLSPEEQERNPYVRRMLVFACLLGGDSVQATNLGRREYILYNPSRCLLRYIVYYKHFMPINDWFL